jgi:ABC-type sugar transport system substrate-binding protein
MNTLKIFTIITLIIFSMATPRPCISAASGIRVTVLTPDTIPRGYFWELSVKFMRAVAEDLNIDLQIDPPVKNLNADADFYSLERSSESIINSSPKPDYFLTGYWGDGTLKIFPKAMERNIKIFTFNSDVYKEHVARLGAPREKYPNWIAHMSPNDRQAGYDLIEYLVKKSREANKITNDKNIHIIGLDGTQDSPAANLRIAGFKQFCGSSFLTSIYKIDRAQWRYDQARELTLKLYKDDPASNVIWAASDFMALGAIDAYKSLGKVPGKDFFSGGIDWSAEGIKAVASGDMMVTIGGHFMEGGWALLLIHDYHKGIDFAEEMGTVISTPMHMITPENINMYQQTIGNQKWWDQIDFKKFSKIYNRNLKTYDLTLDALHREQREKKPVR